MKKVLAILLALAFAAFLLPGCPGGGGGGGGGEEWGAAVARAVDRQFGPVTVVNSDDGPTIAAGGGGSHEAVQLGGKASSATVKMAVQYVMETWLPKSSIPLPTTPVPGKAGLGSKLAALGSAVSVDNNPCEQDGDNDGIPDVNEDLGDPITDQHDWGLCVEGDAVDCRGGEGSFTIKFTDCQINNTTTWSWWSTWITNYVASGWVTNTNLSPGFQVTAWASTRACTDTTVNGTVAKIIAGWDQPLDTVNGVAHNTVSESDGLSAHTNFCGWWNPTSSVVSGTAFTEQVQCAWGRWYDRTTVAAGADAFRYHPYSPWLIGTYLGSFTNPVEIMVNGSITLAMGGGGVDEQLLHTRYNNLVQVWDTDGLGMATNPYVIYNGQALDYRVLDSNGEQASGTTWGGLDKNAPLSILGYQIGEDRMLIENRGVKMDMDGEDGLVFEPGQYNSRHGFDNEDYWFLFTEGNNIVSWNDKNGSREVAFGPAWPSRGFGGWRLVGATATGNPIYALSFYEKDNGENDKCSVPQNKTPCRINVEVNQALRTFDVLSIANCQLLDTADIPQLTDVVF